MGHAAGARPRGRRTPAARVQLRGGDRFMTMIALLVLNFLPKGAWNRGFESGFPQRRVERNSPRLTEY
jgi:hypothetical protein